MLRRRPPQQLSMRVTSRRRCTEGLGLRSTAPFESDRAVAAAEGRGNREELRRSDSTTG